MKSTKPFLKAGWLGLATIAFSFLLQSVSPNSAARMQEGFTSPVLAFEFAESEEEVVALFDFDSEKEKTDFQAQIRWGTNLDFVFMILYNGFLFLLGWIIFRLSGKKLFLYILPLAVLAFAGDLLENLQLLSLTKSVDSGHFGNSIFLLQWFTWIKWGALAVIMGLLGIWLIKGNLWSKLLTLVAFAVPVLAVIAFFKPGMMSEIFSLGIGIMFLGMTIYSLLYKSKEAAQDI